VETVTILRELWRLRIAVALTALIAIAVGWAVAFEFTLPPKGKAYTVGVANARILVDTPDSQVVEVSPAGSETLGSRANVLANLMVDGELKAAIAQRAGLAPNKLVAGADSSGGPEAVAPLTQRSYALTTGVVVNTEQAELPIIKVQAQAPDTRRAIQLANAAVAGLSDYLEDKAATEKVAAGKRLRVSGLGSAQGHAAARGPSRFMALVVTMFLFAVGCVALLGVAALIRGWRVAAAFEKDAGRARLDNVLEYPTAEADPPPARANGTGARSKRESGKRAAARDAAKRDPAEARV
jgi:ABC-type Na+ efflux pump permease subunit